MKNIRYGSIIAISSLLLMLSVLATYLIDNMIQIESLSLQTLTNIISIVSSIILLSTALILYKRFNGSQLIVDKQTEKVVEILTLLSSLRFDYSIFEGREKIKWYLNFQLTNYKKRRGELFSKDKKDYREYTNYAAKDILTLFSHLTKIASDPYLPKQVARHIKIKFDIYMATVVDDKELLDERFIVGVDGSFRRTNIKDTDNELSRSKFITELNGKEFTNEDIMFDLEGIYLECREWVRDNNKEIFSSLNIDAVEKFDRKKDIY